MRHLAISVWLLVWCASADAQPDVVTAAAGGGSPATAAVSPSRLPEYHSPSEVWLPFFRAVVDRFQREKAPSQTAITSLREAQANITSVNQLASYLVTKTLQEDVSGYFVLLEASDRAGKRAEKAAADLRETTLSEEKYGWMMRAQASAGLSEPATVKAARSDVARTIAEYGVARQQAVDAAVQLNQKFAAAIQPHEETTANRMSELAQQVSEEARKRGITSKVKVRTSQPGAIAHFQTQAQRLRSEAGISSQQMTNDTDDALPIGMYYIWTERNGAISSDKNRFLPIVDAEVTVAIAETQK